MNYLLDWSFGSFGADYHRGDGTTTTPESTMWVDDTDSPMRNNLGNIIYFNKSEAA